MIDFQKSYSVYCFIVFLPIVFIGAFFLLNLLLAVINVKFTAQKNAQDKMIAERKRKENEMKKRPVSESAFDEDAVPD
jgi:regulatory protein YycI of two-component signal transduction system YycFG